MENQSAPFPKTIPARLFTALRHSGVALWAQLHQARAIGSPFSPSVLGSRAQLSFPAYAQVASATKPVAQAFSTAYINYTFDLSSFFFLQFFFKKFKTLTTPISQKISVPRAPDAKATEFERKEKEKIRWARLPRVQFEFIDLHRAHYAYPLCAAPTRARRRGALVGPGFGRTRRTEGSRNQDAGSYFSVMILENKRAAAATRERCAAAAPGGLFHSCFRLFKRAVILSICILTFAR